MVAVPNHGNIEQGERKLKLVFDYSKGENVPVMRIVDVETGKAVYGVASVLVKPEKLVAYVELVIDDIEAIPYKKEEHE